MLDSLSSFDLADNHWWQGILVFGLVGLAVLSVALIRLRPTSRGTLILFCGTLIGVGLLAISAASVLSPIWPLFAVILSCMVLGATADWRGQRQPVSL